MCSMPNEVEEGKGDEVSLELFFEGDPAAEQATAEPDQPDAVY